MGVAITPGGVFYRYWSHVHGGVLRVADPTLSEKIIDELRLAPIESGRLNEANTNQFLSEANAVVKLKDSLYFVHDNEMLRDGEDILRQTPPCLLQLIKMWPAKDDVSL